MDFLAIASIGTFPTPTPTAAQRMASVVTYGLFLGPRISNSRVALNDVTLNPVILNLVELNLVFIP